MKNRLISLAILALLVTSGQAHGVDARVSWSFPLAKRALCLLGLGSAAAYQVTRSNPVVNFPVQVAPILSSPIVQQPLQQCPAEQASWMPSSIKLLAATVITGLVGLKVWKSYKKKTEIKSPVYTSSASNQKSILSQASLKAGNSISAQLQEPVLLIEAAPVKNVPVNPISSGSRRAGDALVRKMHPFSNGSKLAGRKLTELYNPVLLLEGRKCEEMLNGLEEQITIDAHHVDFSRFEQTYNHLKSSVHEATDHNNGRFSPESIKTRKRELYISIRKTMRELDGMPRCPRSEDRVTKRQLLADFNTLTLSLVQGSPLKVRPTSYFRI